MSEESYKYRASHAKGFDANGNEVHIPIDKNSENVPYYTNGSEEPSTNECEMCNEIDRLTSRHIAKLLTKLGSTIPPVVEQEIKRQFRFLSDDIKTSVTGEHNDEDQEDKWNR